MSTNADRQRKFRENMKRQGMVQVTIWVPADQAEAIKAKAKADVASVKVSADLEKIT